MFAQLGACALTRMHACACVRVCVQAILVPAFIRSDAGLIINGDLVWIRQQTLSLSGDSLAGWGGGGDRVCNGLTNQAYNKYSADQSTRGINRLANIGLYRMRALNPLAYLPLRRHILDSSWQLVFVNTCIINTSLHGNRLAHSSRETIDRFLYCIFACGLANLSRRHCADCQL